jgi:hypothetical protein
MDWSRRLADADYLIDRTQQELRAAIAAIDLRVRNVHLKLADAYAFRLREMTRQQNLAGAASVLNAQKRLDWQREFRRRFTALPSVWRSVWRKLLS